MRLDDDTEVKSNLKFLWTLAAAIIIGTATTVLLYAGALNRIDKLEFKSNTYGAKLESIDTKLDKLKDTFIEIYRENSNGKRTRSR